MMPPMNEKGLVSYLLKFMEKASLFPDSGRGFIGVSGGVDSVLLLYCLIRLKKRRKFQSLSVLHVDHGYRLESGGDRLFVEDLCRHWNIPCFTISLSLKKRSNFEQQARDARYKFFSSHLREGDLLYLAHHLSDSFEWFLMESFRSGGIRSSLGIPLKRNQIARPFMCLSADQVRSWARVLNLSWREDSSNKDKGFLRNYVREEIVPRIEVRFPRYLRHYAQRSNKLASFLGLSAFHEKKNWKVVGDCWGGIGIIHPHFENDFTGAEELITKQIQKISEKKRGVLSKQILKMVQAAGKREGPFFFSGGVQGYTSQGMLYLIHSRCKEKYLHLDQKMAVFLRSIDFSRYPLRDVLSLYSLQNTPFPHLIFWKKGNNALISGRKAFPVLWPATAKAAWEKELEFHSLFRLLYILKKRKWKRPLQVISWQDLPLGDSKDQI